MTATPSDDPITYWKEKGGPRWVRQQERLDRQLAPFGDLVCEAAGLEHAQSVLDVGCGTGASTFAVASRLKSGARIVGVDVSTVMLARADERLEDTDVAHEVDISFLEANAQEHTFSPQVFDRLTSRFGVMFFEDPDRAFQNLRGALAPRGTVTFVCWRSPDLNPWMGVPAKVSTTVIPQPEEPPPLSGKTTPGPFGFQDRDVVLSILKEAGFADVDIESKSLPCVLGGTTDLEEAVDFSLEVGPAAAVLRDADPKYVPLMRDALRDAFRPYVTEEGVVMDASVWLVQACG